MAEVAEILQKIEQQKQDWSSLFERMDGDRALFHQSQFKLTDREGKPMKNVENLTFNDAQTFAVRVINTLNSAEMQTIVEGRNIKKEQATLVENFFRLLFLAADERLAARDIPMLRFFHNEMASVRGRLVTRVLLSGDGKDFVPDLIPCDPRFTVYAMGLTGPKWVAVETVRSAEQIEDEYGFTPDSNENHVVDYWDGEREEVFVEDEWKWGQPNKNKKPPFVITSCAGSMLTDADAEANRAESIYSSDRNLYEPMNRIGSILYTEVAKLLKPPMQFKNILGQAGKPPKVAPYGEGLVIPVGINEGFDNMPRADLTQAGRLIIAMLEQRLQRGALPAVDYGNLTFPLSAVAIKGLQGAKDQIFLPRLQALAIHYRAIARMIREQYILHSFNALLGDAKTDARIYPAADIDGDYDIFFKFNAVNPEQDVANYSIAEAARAWFSDEYIMSHILQVDDPIEIMNQKWAELAYKSNEVLAKLRMIKALQALGHGDAAKLLADEMKTTYGQLKQLGTGGNGSKPTVEKVEEGTKGTPAVPLLGTSRGPGRPTGGRPAQEQILQAPETAASAVGSEG